MATKYEYLSTGDSSGVADDLRAQTFTPATEHGITYAKMLLYKSGILANQTVSIRATSAGAPTGADLTSVVIDVSSLTTTPSWVTATFPSAYYLAAGTVYALCVNGGGTGWRKAPEAYAGGNAYAWYSSTWNLSGGDFLFEDWGNPWYVSFPSEAITRVTNLIHRYNRKRGIYTLEMSLGEVTSDFGLPEWATRPQPLSPKPEDAFTEDEKKWIKEHGGEIGVVSEQEAMQRELAWQQRPEFEPDYVTRPVSEPEKQAEFRKKYGDVKLIGDVQPKESRADRIRRLLKIWPGL